MAIEITHLFRGGTPACAGHPDPELWFPEGEGTTKGWNRTSRVIAARAICDTCPVKQECFEWSVQFIDLSGIWGGKDITQRAWYRRKLNIKGVPVLNFVYNELTQMKGNCEPRG